MHLLSLWWFVSLVYRHFDFRYFWPYSMNKECSFDKSWKFWRLLCLGEHFGRYQKKKSQRLSFDRREPRIIFIIVVLAIVITVRHGIQATRVRTLIQCLKWILLIRFLWMKRQSKAENYNVIVIMWKWQPMRCRLCLTWLPWSSQSTSNIAVAGIFAKELCQCSLNL